MADPVFTATKFTPIEVSLVNLGADGAARIRGMSMEPTTNTPTLDPEAIRAEAIAGERDRISRLTTCARTLGLQELGNKLVASDIDADAGVRELLRIAADRQSAQGVAHITSGHSGDDPAWRRTAMADALTARICRTAPPEHAREWSNASLLDLMHDSLRASGQRVDRRNVDTLVRAGLHTTSDFALILADAQNKSLRRIYEAQPSGVRALARQTTARDFRALHHLQAGEFPFPELVNEHGEFHRGTMSESDETYSLATYGKIFAVTRQVLINDDAGAFSQIVRKAAVASAEFIASQLALKVSSNPNLSDGTPVFHANHGNLASAAAIDETSLSAMRVLMRNQRGLNAAEPFGVDGRIYVNAVPKYILTGAARETSAEKILTVIAADSASNTNIFAGRLTNVVDPRVTGTPEPWYLVADPDQIDGLEYAFLDGAEGPQVETRVGFDVDGVETKLRIDFGCGWIDYRGWVKNPGT